jgi:acetyl-CoA carboxylase carboxyl transferase subunit alpha
MSVNGSGPTSAWSQVELARHVDRPYSLDYIQAIFRNFTELHGDRLFGDDHALIGGPASLDGDPVMVIAQQKGRSTGERALRNFGMANPEGYRKALRLARHAEKFQFPLVVFVDTPAAFPGAGAEERGIAWAIAENLLAFTQLEAPIVTLVIGEGGSGGALGIGVGDRLLMLEHSIYSVAPPETCASILWRDISHKVEAAEALKLTARDLQQLGLVDEIVPEPPGGAQNDYGLTADAAGAAIRRHLAAVRTIPIPQLLDERYQRYRRIGLSLSQLPDPGQKPARRAGSR